MDKTLTVVLVDHLKQMFPQYQFNHNESEIYDRIEFSCTFDFNGSIKIIGDIVELWAQENLTESCYRISQTHKFLLCESDSILWIERFVAAGSDRFSADLTQPLPDRFSADSTQPLPIVIEERYYRWWNDLRRVNLPDSESPPQIRVPAVHLPSRRANLPDSQPPPQCIVPNQ